MKVFKMDELRDTGRQVDCPKGGFVSLRGILKQDKMGFTLTKTIVPVGPPQHWHYRNHLEACYCVSGVGILTDASTGRKHQIGPDVLYILDKNDDHYFKAITEVTLLCVFNPPLRGKEVHGEDGSYE